MRERGSEAADLKEGKSSQAVRICRASMRATLPAVGTPHFTASCPELTGRSAGLRLAGRVSDPAERRGMLNGEAGYRSIWPLLEIVEIVGSSAAAAACEACQ